MLGGSTVIRISKLTDYGIVLLTYLARDPQRPTLTARDLAQDSGLPLPTVGKLLKALSRGSFLESERGINGGYRLAKEPAKITIAEIIALLEGPISLTECAGSHEVCELEHACPARSNWRKINDVVRKALSGLTLADMSHPLPRGFSSGTQIAKKPQAVTV